MRSIRGYRALLGASLTVAMAACTQRSAQTQMLLPAEEKADDNFQAVVRKTGATGDKPSVAAEVTRGSVRINQADVPTWKIKLGAVNPTGDRLDMGETLAAVEKEKNSEGYTAIYVARERDKPAAALKSIRLRHGYTWGVTVPSDSPGVWPFGEVSDGSSQQAMGLLFAILSAPRPKAYRGGGYPSLGPGQHTTFEEEILFPNSGKSGVEVLHVVAPALKPAGRTGWITVFRFGVATASGGKPLPLLNATTIPLAESSLRRLAEDASQPLWLRLAGLSWLAEIESSEPAALLLGYAGDAKANAELRHSAIANLGVRKHRPAVPTLQGMVGDTALPVRTRAIALNSLGEIGDPSVTPSIRPLIADPDALLSSVAMEAAGALKDAEAIPQLLGILSAKADQKKYGVAAKALGAIGTEAAWQALEETAANKKGDFQARRFAILTLGDKARPASALVLSRILADQSGDQGVRLNAIGALGSIDSAEAVPALKAAAADKNKSIASSAVQQLARSKNPAAAAAAIAIAETAGNPMRTEAVQQLGWGKQAGAAPTLRRLLHDAGTPSSLRAEALLSLHRIDPGQVQSADYEAVWSAYSREKDKDAGGTLARALIQSGFKDRAAIPVLIAGLDPSRNKLWFSNVELLRHVTGEKFGPSYEFSDAKERTAGVEQWRQWWASQPSR